MFLVIRPFFPGGAPWISKEVLSKLPQGHPVVNLGVPSDVKGKLQPTCGTAHLGSLRPWRPGHFQGALFPDDARHYRVDVLEALLSDGSEGWADTRPYQTLARQERNQRLILAHVCISTPCLLNLQRYHVAQVCTTIGNCSSSHYVPAMSSTSSNGQASADQHSAIWVNGDKFELSPEAIPDQWAACWGTSCGPQCCVGVLCRFGKSIGFMPNSTKAARFGTSFCKSALRAVVPSVFGSC